MKLEDLLEHTEEEAADALRTDLAKLNKRAKHAREVGDLNQWAILHGHINEDLELLRAVEANDRLREIPVLPA